MIVLTGAKRIRTYFSGSLVQSNAIKTDYQGELASDYIRELILSDNPCLVCRFGAGELEAVLRHLAITSNKPFWYKSGQYFKDEIGPFWWDEKFKRSMTNNTGFFPTDEKSLAQFATRMLKDVRSADVLGSWLPGEARLQSFFADAKIIRLKDLEPYYHEKPWSEVLANQRVLVIHPFEDSIRNQYAKRELLFKNPNVLPKFELQTLKAIQSNAGNQVSFTTWFDALNFMCEKISSLDFDIALIGAGAYGLPLATYIKKLGKKAIHLGGATQLLFGIRGKRWDNNPFFQQLFNEHWVRPLPSEVPSKAKTVENGCYW